MEGFGEYGLVGLVVAVVISQTFGLAKEAIRGVRERRVLPAQAQAQDPPATAQILDGHKAIESAIGRLTDVIEKQGDRQVEATQKLMEKLAENQIAIREDVSRLIAVTRAANGSEH